MTTKAKRPKAKARLQKGQEEAAQYAADSGNQRSAKIQTTR
jgi:hypothetical protein